MQDQFGKLSVWMWGTVDVGLKKKSLQLTVILPPNMRNLKGKAYHCIYTHMVSTIESAVFKITIHVQNWRYLLLVN